MNFKLVKLSLKNLLIIKKLQHHHLTFYHNIKTTTEFFSIDNLPSTISKHYSESITALDNMRKINKAAKPVHW